MFDLLARTKKQHHFIRLNEQFRGDLEWWWVFLKDWNGVLMLYSSRLEHPDVSLWSDASGLWGCGAVWNNRWFQLSWQEVPEFKKAPIAAKELLPIVLAAALWGKEWATSLCYAIATMRQWWHPLRQEGPKRPIWLICSDASFSLRPSVVARLPRHMFQANEMNGLMPCLETS